MMIRYYILDGHKAVACPDVRVWGEWFEEADRQVARDVISDGVSVSTVFLGLNHQFGDTGPPLLFETMIFGGENDEYQTRCLTWEEAEKMHATACAIARGEGV